jgi:hypothetical protein
LGYLPEFPKGAAAIALPNAVGEEGGLLRSAFGSAVRRGSALRIRFIGGWVVAALLNADIDVPYKVQ